MGLYYLTITADGSGDGTSKSWNGDFTGLLMRVRATYSGADAGTDVTLTEPSGIQDTLCTITNNNSTTIRYPTYEQEDTDGNGTGIRQNFRVEAGNLLVTIDEAGSGGIVTITVDILED